jgi:GTPase Era involved in 16S rRNA processing
VNPPAGLDLVESALTIVGACGRSDLAERLGQTRDRLLDPSVRVLVVGEFKQGKSELINALLIAPVCPVDEDVATAVPTVISGADAVSAEVVHEGALEGQPPDAERRTTVPVEELARFVSESGNPGNRDGVARAEIGLPRQLLAGGLVLVDTPGVGGLGSVHTARTVAELPRADAVLLVSDASQEYSEPEMDFLRKATTLCPNVAGVLTKTDLYPQWRRIAELDRRHLVAAGIEADLFPVSSSLRAHATRTDDTELNAESGFPELIAFLHERVAGQAAQLFRRSVATDILSVTEQLTMALRTELTALQDPDNSQALMDELEAARQRADGLRRNTSRWQQVLGDGVQDLSADIDHDLRDRTRHIARNAEAAINESDPLKVWDQFSDWLYQQVAQAVADNFVWTTERARWLAGQVAEHFAADSHAVPPEMVFGDATAGLERAMDMTEVDGGGAGIGTSLLVGVRGSYGGLLMVGLLTGLAGMMLFNPLSVGAGVLMGAKAMKEDRDAKLKRRQSEANLALRHYIDDVVFQVGKDSKDKLRMVQRTLRDHFAALAEQMSRSVNDSVQAAQRAAKIAVADRELRVRELKGRLGEIATLRAQATALMSAVGHRL